jgi:hypothetical protein
MQETCYYLNFEDLIKFYLVISLLQEILLSLVTIYYHHLRIRRSHQNHRKIHPHFHHPQITSWPKHLIWMIFTITSYFYPAYCWLVNLIMAINNYSFGMVQLISIYLEKEIYFWHWHLTWQKHRHQYQDLSSSSMTNHKTHRIIFGRLRSCQLIRIPSLDHSFCQPTFQCSSKLQWIHKHLVFHHLLYRFIWKLGNIQTFISKLPKIS